MICDHCATYFSRRNAGVVPYPQEDSAIRIDVLAAVTESHTTLAIRDSRHSILTALGIECLCEYGSAAPSPGNRSQSTHAESPLLDSAQSPAALGVKVCQPLPH
jgi:hypothetical protein